jgi:predicted transcriptional regulator
LINLPTLTSQNYAKGGKILEELVQDDLILMGKPCKPNSNGCISPTVYLGGEGVPNTVSMMPITQIRRKDKTYFRITERGVKFAAFLKEIKDNMSNTKFEFLSVLEAYLEP